MVRPATVFTEESQHKRQLVSRDKNAPLPQRFASKVEFIRAAARLGIAWGGIGFIILMLFLTSVGCTSDAQNIRATNEAAATPAATSTPLSAEIGSTEIRSTNEPPTAPPATSTPINAENDSEGAQNIRATNEAAAKPTATSTPLSAEIGSTDIRDGDCITSKLPEGINIESVVIVPCSANWQYRALSSFTVDDLDRYPGENLFRQRAYEECDRHYTFLLFPIADSWALGDRRVTCLQNSFGLSGTDPAKLDRLVNSSRLNAEECFNEVSETENASVELVSCSGEWQYRVLNSFTVEEFDRYPGEATFNQRTYKECDRHYSFFFFPLADSWAFGDRTVTCLQESFGLSRTDPGKLDRLVGSDRLRAVECFDEAPETGHMLVELVKCSGEWQYRTLNSFMADDFDRYPGEAHFNQRAYSECDRQYTSAFFPTADSWALGDRSVVCIQESFGLSVTDPAKLDRLVGSDRLRAEECFDEAPETGHLSVELVSCSGEWQYRVLNSFTVEEFDRYPGEATFNQRAYKECDRHYSFFFFPLADSWAFGDRTVTCLQESFGLSRTDPGKLDRLVGSDRLRAEECFDEAPETGHLLVELVNCSSEWQYRVLNALAVEDLYQYPGKGLFDQRAYSECDRQYTSAFFPTADSWTLGDRIVTCLQEDFGLSGIDPSKLDRLVNSSRLNAEECFNEAPETEYLLVELVSCSGEWESQVLGRFLVPLDGAYPGDQYFEDLANLECDTSADYYFHPFVETWSLGDRSVICVKSSQ